MHFAQGIFVAPTRRVVPKTRLFDSQTGHFPPQNTDRPIWLPETRPLGRGKYPQIDSQDL